LKQVFIIQFDPLMIFSISALMAMEADFMGK